MQIIRKSLIETPVLEIHDDIDHASAADFHAAAREALDGQERLLLDLSDSRYVDSGGLAAILSLTREVGPDGRLFIVASNRNLTRLFHLVGLDNEPHVRLFPDLVAAERDLAADLN
jgi:anti-anti-sigma factor